MNIYAEVLLIFHILRIILMTHNYNRFYLLMIEKHTHYALTLAGVILMHVVPAICGDGVTHPACLSECLETKDIKVTLVQKRQNYCSDHKTRDTDIRSPKSVTIHPDGSKFYVNSLEGMRTVVFEVPTGKKIKTVQHRFDGSDKELWADESGYYTFKDKRRNPRTFSGKPVESAFSHKGKYLWITYYRRSYDINAQEPSAVAVLDTERDTIIRMFETGPLPKMIAVSDDGTRLAVTHWGDNTVGVMDISSDRPEDWHYISNYVIGSKLSLDYSRTEPVNRDNGSGHCLRGTLFTPDNRYLLVGCMGGAGGIAVIDLEASSYLGRIVGLKPNVRHLICKNGYLYASINTAGYVQRAEMTSVYSAIAELDGKRETARINGWESCKVFPGRENDSSFARRTVHLRGMQFFQQNRSRGDKDHVHDRIRPRGFVSCRVGDNAGRALSFLDLPGQQQWRWQCCGHIQN